MPPKAPASQPMSKEVLKALTNVGLKPNGAAVFYLQNTNEIKDDLTLLVPLMKNETASPGQMGRSEASFLLWYHCLHNNGERVEELLSLSIVGACLSVLATPTASTPDKTCATGILTTLCMTDKILNIGATEMVIKGKTSTGTAVSILHELLNEQNNMRGFAARCLQLVAEDTTAHNALIRLMDGQLPYLQTYNDLLMIRCPIAISGITSFLVALLQGHPELAEQAVAGGLIPAVIHAMGHHRTDSLVRHCAELLAILLVNNETWSEVVELGGLELLVDLLGSPPDTILTFEDKHYGDVLHPERIAIREEKTRKIAEMRAAEAAREAEEEEKRAQAEREKIESTLKSHNSKSFGTPRCDRSARDLSNPPASQASIQAASTPSFKLTSMKSEKTKMLAAAEAAEKLEASKKALAAQGPLPAKEELLSYNKAALQWNAIVSVQMRATVAGCLYKLLQDTTYMHRCSALLATSRLVPLITAVLAPPDAGKKGKAAKSKKLKLTPEQNDTLVNITGALKFLTLVPANCYRVAKLGALNHLITLYKESSNTLLRRNAQVILANIADVAECGAMLLEAKLPETFLVEVPVKLIPSEIELLLREFPDAAIGPNAPKPLDAEDSYKSQKGFDLKKAKA